jgi:hypothetical protein
MRKNTHFRRIPNYIEQEHLKIKSQHVVVAAIINASKAELNRGTYYKFGIRMNEGNVVVPEIITPDRLHGLYARHNRNGIVRVLKDLPKVTKTIWWESPNFGDPDKGYHSNYRDILVYQRRLEPPRDWEIGFSLIKETEDFVQIKAQIQTILDKEDADFKKDLFFAINLLQEQFHDCHVFDASMADEEIAQITTVGWEIFPPGTMDRAMAVILHRMHNTTTQRQHEIQSRAQTLECLHPTGYIVGSGMNSHYFGAKFGENIVAFENADYGNAIYILFDNWEEISRMSRIDILKRHEQDFIRIVHKKGWEKKLKHYIDELRAKSQAPI